MRCMAGLLFRREGEDGGAVVGLAGFELGGGEGGVVGGIGVVLGFEAEAEVLGVGGSGFSFQGAVEEVAGVELDAGFGGGDGEDSSGGRVVDFGGFLHGSGWATEDPIMVVAVGDLELVVRGIDALADGGGFAKIERSSGDGRDAGGDEAGVDGSVAVGGNGEDVREDGAGAVSRQVEVRVVGEVDNSVLVGRDGVVDAKGGAFESVFDVGGEGAGEALIHVRADVGELDAVGELFGVPDGSVEADGAAVEGVAIVILGNLIGLTVEDKFASGEAVAIATYDGADVRAFVGLVVGDGVEAESDVGDNAGAVGNFNGDNPGSVGDQAHLSLAADEGIKFDRFAIFGSAETRLCDRGLRCEGGSCECHAQKDSAYLGHLVPLRMRKRIGLAASMEARPTAVILRQGEDGGVG